MPPERRELRGLLLFTRANEITRIMVATKRIRKVRTLPRGTKVEWHYRAAIGHGTVAGVDKLGATHATTRYKIREHDHHPGEPAYVYHYGRALRRAR